MKIIKIIVLFFFIIINKNEVLAITKSKIVLKVENEIITNYEVKNKILTSLVLSNEEINQQNINKLKAQALDFLIINKLRKIELSKYNFELDNNTLTNYLNTISSNNINNFKRKFVINNLNYDLYLDEIETQLKWQKLIYEIYSKKIVLDENNINEEVKKIINNKSIVEEYKLSEIEIFLENNETDLERISNIEKQISENGFKSTALKFSNASTASAEGDLGWVNLELISKPISKVLKNLKIGEVSPPVKRQNSVIFFKLDDKRILQSENIDEKSIRNNLIRQKRNELFNMYSNSHLSKIKNNTLIEYK